MERKKRKLLGSEVKWYAFLNFRRDYNYTESCKRSERACFSLSLSLARRERNKTAAATPGDLCTQENERRRRRWRQNWDLHSINGCCVRANESALCALAAIAIKIHCANSLVSAAHGCWFKKIITRPRLHQRAEKRRRFTLCHRELNRKWSEIWIPGRVPLFHQMLPKYVNSIERLWVCQLKIITHYWSNFVLNNFQIFLHTMIIYNLLSKPFVKINSSIVSIELVLKINKI